MNFKHEQLICALIIMIHNSGDDESMKISIFSIFLIMQRDLREDCFMYNFQAWSSVSIFER
jgi:hypothetical protein